MPACISRRDFTVLAGAAAAGTLTGCQHNPELGRSQFILIPDSWLAWYSEDSWKQILQQSQRLRGTTSNKLLEQVGTRVADASGQTDVNWEFALLENKTPNAFVLPGGKVAFHTGMIPLLKNEAQMAAVMGHEAGHVAAHHAAERVSQALAANGALLAARLYFGGDMDRNTRNLLFGALGAGVTYGILMPYSRQHEYEADQLGLKYMASAGYDPRDKAQFWQSMMQYSAGLARPMEFMSTHPADDKRLAEIQAHLPEVMPIYEQKRRA